MRGPKKEKAVYTLVHVHIQLFRERLSEKVHATIPRGIVAGFEFTPLQRNLKEWQERPWTYVCECQRKAKKAGSTATVVSYSVMIISHITFRDCRVHFFGDNLSRNSCIHSLAWWDRITTCAFFKTTYLILLNPQAVAGGKKCCFRGQILAVTTW